MVNPTLTFNQGWSTNCYDTTGWVETEDGNTATLTVDNDDIFNINVSASVANQSVYYENTLDSAVPTSSYPFVIVRYKTSSSSIKAKVELECGGGSITMLDETDSTTWKTATYELTPADVSTLKIRLFANKATGDVYYHFLIIGMGQFTFPHVGTGGVQVQYPTKTAIIEIPGRDGDVLQKLGLKSPIITITGDVDPSESAGASGWESATGPHFEYILRALRSDVWNWFTCDHPDLSCQVMLHPDGFETFNDVTDAKATLKYRLKLIMYQRSSLDLATWDDMQWVGYEP